MPLKPDKLKAKAGSGKAKSGASGPSYSDDNSKWLKPKKVDLFVDADDDAAKLPPTKLAKAASGKPKAAAGRAGAPRPAARKFATAAPAAPTPPAKAAARPVKRKQPPAAAPQSDDEEEEVDEFDMGEDADMLGGSDESGEEEQVVRGGRRGAAARAGGDSDEESEGGSESEEVGSDDGSGELAFERKARATVARLAADSKIDAAELLKQESSFAMPSAEQLEAEARAPPDIPALKARVGDVVGVLGDFAARRQPEVNRADYVALLAADLQVRRRTGG